MMERQKEDVKGFWRNKKVQHFDQRSLILRLNEPHFIISI
jgi:hypothetical protein